MALLDPDNPAPEGVGKDTNPAPKRFAVYRNNVVVSLMEALAAAYPSILAIMGQENFDRVARIYVSEHPPVSPIMQQFGSEFHAFLEGFKPLRKSPFLTDVARAESAWLDAWHAADAQCLTPEQLGGVDPERTLELVFSPHPAVHLLSSAYPLFDLFNARYEWPAPGLNLDEAQSVLITRPVLECRITPLDRAQTAFVSALISGQSLGASISEAGALSDNFDPASAIALVLQTGTFRPLDARAN